MNRIVIVPMLREPEQHFDVVTFNYEGKGMRLTLRLPFPYQGIEQFFDNTSGRVVVKDAEGSLMEDDLATFTEPERVDNDSIRVLCSFNK